MGAPGGHDDGRILSDGAGPASWEATDLARLVHVDDAVLPPEMAVVDQIKLTSQKRVERMSDSKTSAHTLRIVCS